MSSDLVGKRWRFVMRYCKKLDEAVKISIDVLDSCLCEKNLHLSFYFQGKILFVGGEGTSHFFQLLDSWRHLRRGGGSETSKSQKFTSYQNNNKIYQP